VNKNRDGSGAEMVECTAMIEGKSGVTVEEKKSKNVSPMVSQKAA